MKGRLLGFFLFLSLLIYQACTHTDPPETKDSSPSTIKSYSSGEKAKVDSLDSQLTPVSEIAYYFNNKMGKQQVLVKGIIIRLLAVDTDGDAHQRFIIRLDNGQTLLIAHNIDLAPRIPNIKTNQVVYAYGVYEYNREGGVVHWTHRDPNGRHEDGFLYYNGVQYE